VAYERAVARRGGLDFDDLVVRALRALEDDAPLLYRRRESCATAKQFVTEPRTDARGE
jgi:hypothetical protein